MRNFKPGLSNWRAHNRSLPSDVKGFLLGTVVVILVLGVHVALDWKKPNNQFRDYIEERITEGKPIKEFIEEKLNKSELVVAKVGLDKSVTEICKAMNDYEEIVNKLDGKIDVEPSNVQCDTLKKLEGIHTNIVGSLDTCEKDKLQNAIAELEGMSLGIGLLNQQFENHMSLTALRFPATGLEHEKGMLASSYSRMGENTALFKMVADQYGKSAKRLARKKCGLTIS